uniref:Major facilitator superfamily (MFS) profile domain-containing protein n=1 Tax=Phasianus colchicus TaxID=9054 RepID=A0A669PIT2_PHACC
VLIFTLQVQFQGLFQMVLVLGIGGSFPYGFHISVINSPSVHIRKFINETWIERHGSPLHPETIMLLWSFIVSVFGIGGFLGSLCLLLELNSSRVQVQQVQGNIKSLIIFYLKGFSLNIHPQYVGEISPKKLRGFTNSTVSVFLTLGKLTGQVVGLREILGSEALWPWLLASSGLSALLQLVTLPFFPDSPSYLLIQKGNEEAFRKGRVPNLPPNSCDRAALVEDTSAGQSCSAQWCHCHCKDLQQEQGALRNGGNKYTLLVFCFSFTAGASITIMVEIFSQSFRPSAFLIVGCINWMGLFVLGMIFPLIVDNLGPFCFLIFLGILALSATFIYLYLPETKGKSIMEIMAEFNKLNFGKKEISVTENNFPKDQLFCTKL